MTEEFSRWLRSLVPDEMRPALRSARHALRKTYYAPVDALHAIRHKNDLIPPPSLMFVGDGDFRKTGEEFKAHFITLGGLKPDHRVLDIRVRSRAHGCSTRVVSLVERRIPWI